MVKINEIDNELGKISQIYYQSYLSYHEKIFIKKYNNILKTFSKSLNKYHNLNLSLKDWKLIICPWLGGILNIYLFYDFILKKNNSLINKTKKKILKLETKKKFETPFKFEDYVRMANSKNFFIYFLNLLLNQPLEYQTLNQISVLNSNLKKNFFLKIIKLLPFFNYVYISRPKLDKYSLLNLFFSSKFKIIPIPVLDNLFIKNKLKVRCTPRKDFLNFVNKNDTNYKIIKILLHFMPSIYLEHFKNYNSLGKKILNKPKAVYSDSTYISDEVLKFQISSWKCKIFIGQHGGNFRIYKNTLINIHEHDIATKFVVWGKKIFKKDLKLPSMRISQYHKSHKSLIDSKKISKIVDICYVLGPIRNSNFQSLFHCYEDFEKSIKNKINFVSNLKKSYIFKTYVEDKRYLDQIPLKNLPRIFKLNKKKFTRDNKIIFKSQLLVFDYLSTMIFEVLDLNIPFIIIINKKNHAFSNYGKNLIKRLSKIGVVYYNYYDAIKFANSKISFNDWWMGGERQSIIRSISKDYCFTSKNYLELWKKFLLSKQVL